MPELPEVETVRRSLLEHLPNTEIKNSTIFNPVIIGSNNPEAFAKLQGIKFLDITRRGKYLLLHLSNDQTMIVHLRMTGRLLFNPTPLPLPKHTHFQLELGSGSQVLFVDTRRFGRIWLVANDHLDRVSGLNTLALEPLDEDFNLEYWETNIKRRPKSMIKGVLLDQHMVAGLGNIYADEVLFAAKVHPERLSRTLTTTENIMLCQSMKQILEESIQKRGTTFRDYVDGNNQKGGYQDFLQIFMKAGEPCPNCGTIIQKIKVAGRSSYFCPNCQQT